MTISHSAGSPPPAGEGNPPADSDRDRRNGQDVFVQSSYSIDFTTLTPDLVITVIVGIPSQVVSEHDAVNEFSGIYFPSSKR